MAGESGSGKPKSVTEPTKLARLGQLVAHPRKWGLVLGNLVREPAWNISKEVMARRRTPDTIRRRGIVWHLEPSDSVISRRIFLLGQWDANLWRWFARRCPQRSSVLDIGANLGAFCIPLAKARPDLTIHAFEPARHTVGLLRRNVEANGLENVVVHQVALGADKGTATLHHSATNHGNFSLIETTVYDPSGEEPVPIVRLDSFGFQNVSGVKVDIEGFEPFFLQGAQQTLASSKPMLCLEYGADTVTKAGLSPPEYLDMLARSADLLHVRRRHGKPRGRAHWTEVKDLQPDQGVDLFLHWR